MKKDRIKYDEFYKGYSLFFKEGLCLEQDQNIKVHNSLSFFYSIFWNFNKIFLIAYTHKFMHHGEWYLFSILGTNWFVIVVRIVEFEARSEDKFERICWKNAGRTKGNFLPLFTEVNFFIVSFLCLNYRLNYINFFLLKKFFSFLVPFLLEIFFIVSTKIKIGLR